MSDVSVEMFRLFARYNRWMNVKLYTAAHGLPEEQLMEDRRAFFGSIFQTLNHLMFGDLFLLTRVRDYFDEPTALDGVVPQREFEPIKIYCTALADLTKLRTALDDTIVEFTDTLTDPMLRRSKNPNSRVEYPLWVVLIHLFNHQTHHRGQITTLYSQLGMEIGITDINMFFIETSSDNAK